MSWSVEDFSRPCPRDGYYDVFISFRGIDTRSGFTDTLYRSLLESKIYTFIDADLAGNVIETLFEIIGRSRMAVVVYSERFASSRWCLTELEMIMKRWKDKKMLMIPIFYKVDAHELKHWTEKTTKYFDEHIIKYGETVVRQWKDAVTKIGNVSGFPYRDVYSRSERDFINTQVIATIKKKLREWGETGQESNTTKPYNSNSGHATTENHDVFISFLGKDTHYDLINHLYEALINDRKDIKIFMVDRDHRKDDSIFEVIQRSKMTVVVFSPNYASSKWCLRELVKILQCSNTSEQELLPIFYEIIQPDLINQVVKGKIADHLQKHARNEKSETLQSWRNAIIDLGNMVGWRYSTTHSKTEELAYFIQGLVEEISTILNRVEEENKESTMNQQTLQTYVTVDAEVEEGGVISEMDVVLRRVEKLKLSSNDQQQADERVEKLESEEEELSFNDQQQAGERVEKLESEEEELSFNDQQQAGERPEKLKSEEELSFNDQLQVDERVEKLELSSNDQRQANDMVENLEPEEEELSSNDQQQTDERTENLEPEEELSSNDHQLADVVFNDHQHIIPYGLTPVRVGISLDLEQTYYKYCLPDGSPAKTTPTEAKNKRIKKYQQQADEELSCLKVPIMSPSKMEKKPAGILAVKILRATKLRKDLLGKFDPYVKLKLTEEKLSAKKTTVQHSNPNPEWNEEFNFVVKDPESQALELLVLNWEKVGKHNEMGMNVIPLKEFTPNEPKEMKVDLLKNMDPKEKDRGYLVLQVTYKPFNQVPDGTPQRGGLLVVIVHEATNVQGKNHTNPYVSFVFRGEEKKTQIVKKNRDPRWDEEFQFILEEPPMNDDRLHFEVMSVSSRLGLLYPKEMLGYVDIPLSDVVFHKKINNKYNLIDSKNGRIQIELQWMTFRRKSLMKAVAFIQDVYDGAPFVKKKEITMI